MFYAGLILFIVSLLVAAYMAGFLPNVISIPVGEQSGFLIIAAAASAAVIGLMLMVLGLLG